MANALNNNPIIIDTDITSYRTAAPSLQGVRVNKLMLATGPGGASIAGTVTITAPSDGSTLYPPVAVVAASPIDTILYNDNPTAPNTSLTWRDFAVTGVTATGTRLFLWTSV